MNSQIPANNTRRFTLLGDFPVVLAICGSEGRTTLFAEVGTIDGVVCFVSEPRHYWADELEEVR